MTQYAVRLVEEVEDDLEDLASYIAERDSPERADYVLERLLEACQRLEQAPERGHFLPELLPMGIKEFREINFKPYRIIYEVVAREVFVQLIVDGRRNLQSLLERRLLR